VEKKLKEVKNSRKLDEQIMKNKCKNSEKIVKKKHK
jgi:hypothetical protein